MQTKTKLVLAVFLITFAIFGRMLPHAWNFTPLIAVGLFSGAYLGKKYAFAVPLIAMLLSDMFIGFYEPMIMLSVYGSILLAGFFGLYLQKKVTATNVVAFSFLSSTAFFLATNIAVWAFGTMYSKGFTGVLESLIAGLPFYRNMLVGDIWFSAVLFGTYELSSLLLKSKSVKLKLQTINLKS